MVSTSNSESKNKNAIIVEDEQAIAQLLKLHLQQMGFFSEISQSSEEALDLINKYNFDICLLDWMLPGMQGVDLLKKIRVLKPSMKTLMVTAKSDPDSIVTGLEAGADDYLTKPFDSKVLAARIRHMMRRTFNVAEELVNFAGLTVNFEKRMVKLDNEEIHLTPFEFKLIEVLFKAKGTVLTREKLIGLIQGEDINVTGRTIDTHVFTLRKKLGSWSKHIETIRGVGYRILISSEDVTEEGM